MSVYDENFYQDQSNGSYKSAMAILPLVIKSVFGGRLPQSVIDVGCGVGTWLKAWHDLDSLDSHTHTREREMHCIGIDGNDVDFSLYQIPTSHYLQVDLSTQHTEILRQIKERFHNTQFDLVQSLEVAEHLPNEAAREFIALLTSLGNIVLFSAAIPYQGGTGHINEQPPMYWSALFEERGFVCFDVLRDEIWDMEYVEIWYRQNILIFANDIGAKWLKENGLTPKEARFLIHYESWKHIDEHIKYLESKLSKYRFLRQPAKCIKNIFHWK